MKTAMITGGMGFIGSYIARELIQDGHVDRVVILDHFGRYVSPYRPEFTDYRKLRLEGIADRVVIERGEAKHVGVLFQLLDRHRPDLIFHLAALPLAKLSNLNVEEAREGSIDSTAFIFEVIGTLTQRDGWLPERVVYASSSMVYGDFVTDPATEEHPTKPKEIYGTMKLAGERIADGLGRFYNVPVAIVRPSAVYGPTDMNRRVSQIFLEKAIAGEMIEVAGEDETLDFTYVKDVAHGFVLAGTHPAAAAETFNITFGQAQRLVDYVEALKTHFPGLRYTIKERDAFRPRRGTLSIEKAQRLLGFEPVYSLQRGVDEYVDFARRHNPLFARVAETSKT
ncbi:NAD-dependent epimerase/dehydratase family protein [Rhodospira trueperi]|uniref:Nucleoside-diphosphate-sugar epimerase n=1 Tax=Rhodospira trueperi TaxID=69960 RepID=A0A1G7GPT3_9PROT|nr:NAD(P)-dependent oxidoreductase [Rhodospira trueperi]SDE90188.1 Nucleoside-diphosphate-sugar epimerase [Rhodospira trueperi]